MTRRNPPAKWVLPKVINPPKRRCFVIEVPDELFHIAAFRGALLDLASAYKWSDDLSHTARKVALVWRDVIANMKTCDELNPPAGGDFGDEFMIRQNPANPCLIETSADGIHWCLLADISLCIPAGPQPGAGAEQPPSGGGQTCYNGVLLANGKWMLPYAVSTGDVIDLQSANGAGNEGGAAPWHCPDGSTFLAGICIPGTGGTSGTDPLPSVNHMRLIWNVDGTFHDAMNGPYTIPGSVSNAIVFLQVNDSDLTDNAGSYEIKVCTTNNQTFAGVSITYFTGSGPAGVAVGAEFDITSASNGASQHPDFAFSQCVQFTVISSTGFIPFTGAGVVLYAYLDCLGAFVSGPTETLSSNPLDWNSDNPCNTRVAWNGRNDSVFTLRLRIDDIC